MNAKVTKIVSTISANKLSKLKMNIGCFVSKVVLLKEIERITVTFGVQVGTNPNSEVIYTSYYKKTVRITNKIDEPFIFKKRK